MEKELTWSFAQIWNRSLENCPKRKYEPRERIWASEMGGAYIDRYLKMKGVEPTNPPNARSLRKFEAGNIWEAIIGYVLKRAGILLDSQEWLKYQYPNLLPVTGKLDFFAGGTPDYDKALRLIKTEFCWLPASLTQATTNIITHLREKYPQGLKRIAMEMKSSSAFMFEVYERNKTPSIQHKKQIFHYLKSKNIDEGHIIYVCKDDARLLEFGVYNPSPVEALYKEDIEKMTNYLKNNIEPEKEKCIVFSEEFNSFSANYKVGYSNYLTKLYGFKNQFEFDNKYKKMVSGWNRVLKRIKEGKKTTEKNSIALKEIRDNGFDIDDIVTKCKEVK